MPTLVFHPHRRMRACLASAVLALLCPGLISPSQSAEPAPLEGRVIALDIGHSPKAPGAYSARGRTEYSFNQKIVEQLEKHLKELGADVVVINREGREISLTARTRQAKAAGAGLFLSIHHDSVNAKYKKKWKDEKGVTREYSDNFRGYSVFCSRKNGQYEQSKALAMEIGKALRMSGLEPTLHHAEDIPGEGRPLLSRELGVYEFSDLLVLKTARMPAVLVECGVIVHREEEMELLDPRHQEKLVHAIGRGVVDYTLQNRQPGG